MQHDEALYKAREYHASLLEKDDRTAVERHLKGCAECRILYARWSSAEPSHEFLRDIMRDLPVVDTAGYRKPWYGRMLGWGTLAAVLLVGLVFWRPERDWINADRSFAWMGQAPDSGPPSRTDQAVKGERHE